MITRIDVEMIRRQIEVLFLEHPDLRTDENFRLDVLEGQSDALEALDWLVSQIRDAQTIQAAIDLRIQDLDKRKDRYELRELSYRKLAFKIMEAADLRKPKPFAEGTLSLRASQRSVRLINPEMIPGKPEVPKTEYWRVTIEPNVSAIKAALLAGTSIPGAALSNATDTLYLTKG